MARLQDFQQVTPTSSDKILIIQSQGQGLAPYSIKMDSANPTGTGKLSLNRASGSEGNYSVAIGYGNTASGNVSHAENRATTASGDYSHAEGYSTTASGTGCHSEGYTTTASGSASHSEGRNTTGSGDYSHAEGFGTIANHKSQHVFGEYNTADASTATAGNRGNYVEIVGKGSSDANRSNARTLDWSGNEVLAGGLQINGNQPVSTIVPIDVSSLSTSINDKASWDSAFSNLPTTYMGMVNIAFKSGYKAVGFAIKTASNWGSIMGMTNDNLNPYFYTMANGTSVLHRLAYV